MTANELYTRMMQEPWGARHENGEESIHYGLSYQMGGGIRPTEIPTIPDFLKSLADRVTQHTRYKVNYVQAHRLGGVVRPHRDPAGMVVPMIVVGQERTFRVGGTYDGNWRVRQSQREIDRHIPDQEILLQHGSLLVFNGGKTIHSMKPASEDPNFNANGFDYRITLLFRYTTDAMREHGPVAKKLKGTDHKAQYKQAYTSVEPQCGEIASG